MFKNIKEGDNPQEVELGEAIRKQREKDEKMSKERREGAETQKRWKSNTR